jgi:hypothetical protein
LSRLSLSVGVPPFWDLLAIVESPNFFTDEMVRPVCQFSLSFCAWSVSGLSDAAISVVLGPDAFARLSAAICVSSLCIARDVSECVRVCSLVRDCAI